MTKTITIAIILLATILFGLATCTQAQTKLVKQGNKYVTVAMANTKYADTTTTYTYVDSKKVEYPIFKSKTGKYYAWVVSKNGNKYKKYLKLD